MAEDQPAIFYPLNIASYAFAPEDAVLFTAIARLFIAGLATYWFVRTIGGGKFGSLVSAIAFAFSGFMLVFLGHPHSNVAAWLPAFFLTLEWLSQQVNRRHVALVALVIATQLTGGHTETALYTLTAGGLYFIFRVLSSFWAYRSYHAEQSEGTKQVWLALLSFAAAAGLGFALASVHVLPFWEWLQRSAEFYLRSGAENLTSWRLGIKYWLAGILPAVFPNIFGNPTWAYEYKSFFPGFNFVEQTIYVGVIGLALAAAAALVRRREKRILFLAILGLAALGAALRLPVLDWVNYLPLFSIASVGRFRLIYTFCAAVLAGFGAQEVLIRSKDNRAGRLVIAFLLGMIALGVPVLWLVRHILIGMAAQTPTPGVGQLVPDVIVQAFHILNLAMYWPLLIAVAGAVALELYLRQSMSRRTMQGILLLLLIMDLFAFGMNYHATIQPELIFPETPALQRVKSDTGVFRVLGTHIDLMPNTAMLHSLYDIRGLDFPIHRYLELCQAMGGKDWLGYGILFTEAFQPRLLNLLNVKYVLTSSRPGPKVLRDMTLLDVDRDIKIYQNLACLPRAFVVHAVRVAKDSQEALRLLQDPNFDLGAEIVLEKAPPPDVAIARGEAQADLQNKLTREDAEIALYTPNRVVIRTDTTYPGFLFLSDSYYPDWKAYVDGNVTEIYLADYAFRAVYLASGQHVVEFICEPRSFRLAAGVSLLALLSIVVLLVSPWSRSGASRQAVGQLSTPASRGGC